MFGRPEKVNAAQETQEQGRIAQRSEAAADIGHQEDEENKGVHAVFAVLIGFEQRTNDEQGRTLVAASSLGLEKMPKKEQANKVGALIAQKALDAGITAVVFDRNGYLYHGRVKEVAEGARQGGLKF